MNPVIISTDKLSQTSRSIDENSVETLGQSTYFADLPLEARLLLAVPRVRGHLPKATLLERYVLDSLGRIIDPGPEREKTIASVNLLAEVMLSLHELEQGTEPVDGKWLSATESLVLCVLCKIRSGQVNEATQLADHWLNKESLDSLNTAASALCNAACFKHGGPHLFTPGSTGKLADDSVAVYFSTPVVSELSLGELLILNALRLRMRTLRHTNIASRTVPMLREHLALPRIEALLDGLLVESLQYGTDVPDIRCICCPVVSIGESRFLAAISSLGAGGPELFTRHLNSWLPHDSAQRLRARHDEFRLIIQNLGVAVPRRAWKEEELSSSLDLPYPCDHVNQPPMIH